MAEPTIIYAAKSRDDVRGSIPTQIADCEALAELEGRAVEARYRDEAATAYKGNRGPVLTDARAHAERLATEHGSAQIVVQQSVDKSTDSWEQRRT
jgi:hypothetical protein